MDRVWIRWIAIDDQGLLQVEPMLSLGQDFRFIYRSANGVTWNEKTEKLHPISGSSSNHVAWMRRIIEAVRGEYGIELAARDETVWRSVPANLIDDLKAAATPESARSE